MLDRDLHYALKHEAHWPAEECANYEEVKGQVRARRRAAGGCAAPRGGWFWGVAGALFLGVCGG